MFFFLKFFFSNEQIDGKTRCHIIRKASSKLSFLYCNRLFLNQAIRRTLCQSLIFSSMEYCASSWYSGLTCGLRDSLNTFQRKCQRFTLDLGPRDHVGNEEFCSLAGLTFPKRVKYFNLVHAFKVRMGLSPGYLADHFTFVSNVHGHNLRQSRHNFSLAYCHSPMGTFQRSAITEWNDLPADLKSIQSLKVFKFRLKLFLQSS